MGDISTTINPDTPGIDAELFVALWNVAWAIDRLMSDVIGSPGFDPEGDVEGPAPGTLLGIGERLYLGFNREQQRVRDLIRVLEGAAGLEGGASFAIAYGTKRGIPWTIKGGRGYLTDEHESHLNRPPLDP